LLLAVTTVSVVPSHGAWRRMITLSARSNTISSLSGDHTGS
jgi:hypothetical protein